MVKRGSYEDIPQTFWNCKYRSLKYTGVIDSTVKNEVLFLRVSKFKIHEKRGKVFLLGRALNVPIHQSW